MKGYTIPNFFIIGAPKCGTTALSEYLRTHPNVYFSDPKEPYYFAEDFSDRWVSSKSLYLKLFELVDPHHHSAVGEGSINYLFSDVAIPRILEVCPEAKFIVMVRDPVEMVQALHAQLLCTGYENIVNFEEAWRVERERRLKHKIPISCCEPKWLYYSEWGKLGSLVKRLYGWVNPQQVQIIVFDDFCHDARAVYAQVLSFLGLTDDGRLEFPPINERKQIRSVFVQNGLAIGGRLLMEPLRRILRRPQGFGIGKRIMRWNSVEGKRQTARPEFLAELREFYADDVVLLSNLIGKDLSYWCRYDQSALELNKEICGVTSDV